MMAERETKNEIVVYQPDETIRLEVRLAEETVWLNQARLGELFGVDRTVVNRHIHNIYKSGELEASATCAKIAQVQVEGGRTITRQIPFYNLDVIIAVGYRVNSFAATQFRKWATNVLKSYLLKGYAFSQRMNLLEDRVDRRLSKTERDVVELQEKVDFFVRTQTPPLQGVFCDGRMWDARAFVGRLVGRAKKSILLIDNWATVETLDILSAKRKGVALTVVTSRHFDRSGSPRLKITEADVAKFNAQYPRLRLRFSENFHDRFIVIDNEEIYLVGASLKDLGTKCFAFTRLDPGEIRLLKSRIGKDESHED